MKTHQRGFTLVEAVIVITLLLILAEIGGPLLGTASDAIGFHMDRVDLEESANVALTRMSRDIRRLRNDQSVVTASASVYEFVDVDGTQIRYDLSGGEIRRTQNSGTAEPLAESASGLAFRYFDDDGSALASPTVGLGTSTDLRRIEIKTTFQAGSHTITEEVQVRPRNLRHESERFF